MAKIPNIRLVVGQDSYRDVTAYDLDTGEPITNLYAAHFSADASEDPIVKVTLKVGIKFVYEGPADLEPQVVTLPAEEETA